MSENDVCTLAHSPLAENEIITKLHTLRDRALIDSSRFSVSAVAEIKLENNLFAYIGGVNIENHEQNRLSMHAEQLALAIAQTLLGGDIHFSRMWIMGAPETIKNGSTHALADNPVMSCGHCRQILISCATEDAEIISVTVNDEIKPPYKLKDLLPQAFSELDLQLNAEQRKDNMHNLLQNMQTLLAASSSINNTDMFTYLRAIKPHIISEDFKTSPILSCIIKLTNPVCYIPGALVQDVGFLTTDAVFTAFGHAITRFGGRSLDVAKMYFYSEALHAAQFRGSEIQYIRRFVNKDIPVCFFNQTGECASYSLSECIKENYLSLQFSAA